MSAGVFQTFQSQYAAQRIATFPVVNKRPACADIPESGFAPAVNSLASSPMRQG
jgi:hypothetical protein